MGTLRWKQVLIFWLLLSIGLFLPGYVVSAPGFGAKVLRLSGLLLRARILLMSVMLVLVLLV